MGILIKNREQIEGIERSCQLASAALAFIKPFVGPGVSTGELDHHLEKFIYENGAVPAPKGYHGYPTATCISVNEVICHGIPSEYKLAEGDIVNIDVTTILNGYYGDVSTMFAIGNVSEEAQKIMAVAKKALNVGIAQVRPGNHLSNIGYHIAKYVHKEECSVVYQFCGHGVGVAFHEEPQVEHIALANRGPVLQTGMTFTIEPMINLGLPQAIIDESDHWTARTVDGKLSAQYEHTLLVTEKGVRILTKHPD